MSNWKDINDVSQLWALEEEGDGEFPDVLVARKHEGRWCYCIGYWDGDRISPYPPFDAVRWTHYAPISPPELQPHDHVEREAEN